MPIEYEENNTNSTFENLWLPPYENNLLSQSAIITDIANDIPM